MIRFVDLPHVLPGLCLREYQNVQPHYTGIVSTLWSAACRFVAKTGKNNGSGQNIRVGVLPFEAESLH
jgi:hypothetical protein